MLALIRNSDNRIIGSQSGDDEAQLETLYKNAESSGFGRMECEAVIVPDDQFRSMLAAQVEADMPYDQKRKAEYPPIQEQLDALYHAGLFPPEMAARIKAVKDKFPKTEKGGAAV